MTVRANCDAFHDQSLCKDWINCQRVPAPHAFHLAVEMEVRALEGWCLLLTRFTIVSRPLYQLLCAMSQVVDGPCEPEPCEVMWKQGHKVRVVRTRQVWIEQEDAQVSCKRRGGGGGDAGGDKGD